MLQKFKDFDGRNLTTFKIGGRIKKLLIASTLKELKEAIEILSNKKRWLILGAGSNVLISDKGLDGAIKLKGDFLKITHHNNLVSCGGGTFGSAVIKYAENQSLSGMEPFSGLPGTIGGWIATNCGPKEMNIIDILESVTVINKKTLQVKTLQKNDFGYGYRYCSLKNQYGIIKANFKLQNKQKEKIKQENQKFMKYRLSTQPKGSSVGCIFKNPKGKSAGKIIDSCGLKGFKIKNLQVSKTHGNFIINQGKSKAEDVFEMIEAIKKNVFSKTGIKLTAEVEKIGHFKHD
tara:strand:- start:80 stop:949 length:870 start_codon:yes stop_codon:yes gene_type:complete